MAKLRSSLTGQVSDIDIRLLRIYKTVVECGGVSAAEVELNISRPAISTALSDLEKRLGMRLCQRGRAGFSLTDEGANVYDSVLQLLTSLETFKTQVNAIQDQLRGELNIGLIDSLVTMYRNMNITDALSALKTRGPEVQINLRMMPPNEIERAVLDGQLQVGVIPMLRPLSGLNYYTIYTEASELYCSASHPLYSLPDRERNDTLIAEQDAVLPTYALTEEIRSFHQYLNGTATASSREGVAFLLLTGDFIGYLPTHMAERWVNEKRMRALRPDKFSFETAYGAITRKSARPHLVQETFMEELRLNNEQQAL